MERKGSSKREGRKRRVLRIAPAVIACLVLVASQTGAAAAVATVAATHSFTNHGGGTHPGALQRSGETITVDLSAIAGASVARATFDPGVSFDYVDVSMNNLAATTMEIRTGGSALSLVAPRYRTFDATAAVRALLEGGGTTLYLSIADPGAGMGERLSLDVLCDVPLPGSIAQVTGAAVRFDRGDAMITFEEVDPPLTGDSAPCDLFYQTSGALDDAQKTRYRIYRSDEPIVTADAILRSRLVDEIKPLSGWNPKLPGPGGNCYPTYGAGTVYRLPIGDGVAASGGTGIYVDHYEGAGTDTAWYFVSHTVDGAEDFSSLAEGENATAAVVETPGSGMVLLLKEEHATEFMYGASSGQYFYVKWEAPPRANFPSSPFNYLVVTPSSDYAVSEPGVDLALHNWGGSLTGGYGWWYSFEQGHILVAGNQFPFQDWWTGYHENLGTLKSYAAGSVKPFTMHRLMAFVYDFVAPLYNVDLNRITLSGSSMGGAGTSLVGLRNGQLFSNLISWVGIHIPSESPTFASSFPAAWGEQEWAVPFSNEEFAARFGGETITANDRYSVWDYYDNDKWLRSHRSTATPWITFSNGTNDDGIGWDQVKRFTRALVDTKRPFNFQWGMYGHSQRVALLDPYGYDKSQKSHLLFTRGVTVPFFLNASTDDDFDVAVEGKMNAFLSWGSETITDTGRKWGITLFIPDAPPEGSYGAVFPESLTVDVGPAPGGKFGIPPRGNFRWTLTDEATGVLLASGNGRADAYGRAIARGLIFRKGMGERLTFFKGPIVDAIPYERAEELFAAGGAVIAAGNSPNPFNPSTDIEYTLASPGFVEIAIYDVAGRRVRAFPGENREAGGHTLHWDGKDDNGSTLSGGVYFLRLRADGESVTRKMVLVK